MSTDSGQPDGAGSGAEFAPQLSKLESEYQILTELHRSADARTYLARHLELNRDVTITVVRAPAGSVAGESALRHFASDARALTTMRHANVIPVIEGRWLDGGAFAIVRARVRGSSLEQVLDAAGPLSPGRAAWALEQVNGALGWARANGISHRYVSASALIFQQGSGRVLLSLDPPPVATNTLPNTCDDARTIGRLATEMLTGVASAAGGGSLAEQRSDLPPDVIGGIDMLTHCDTNAAPPDVSAVLRSLESVGESTVPAAAGVNSTRARVADVEPGAPSAALPLAAALPVPVAATGDEAVVVVNRGMSFGARVATAAIVIAALIVAGVVLLRHHVSPNRDATTLADTSTQSGGDIALRSARPDTAVIDPTMVTPTIVSPPPPIAAAPAPVQPSTMYPPVASTVAPSAAAASAAARVDSMRAVMDSIANARALAPGRLHEPGRPIVPPLRMPPPAGSSVDTTSSTSSASSSSASSTGAPAASADVCASPAQSDQQSCAIAAKSRSDADVAAALGRVVAALRRQVNAAPGDPDPASVTRLRQAQESWRNDREAFCRDSGVAPMFGRERGRCYSERAAARVRELQQMLDTLPQRDSTSTERATAS